LDVSKVSGQARFHGLEIELHRFAGARALQVVHPGAQNIDEHRHDWAYIGIYTTGRYRERYDGGDLLMSGPCAVLHPPGRPHADEVGEAGLETITIEFDPAWLRLQGFAVPLDRSIAWSGGPAALAARQLATALRDPAASDAGLAEATGLFLRRAMASEAPATPSWLGRAQALMAAPEPVPTHNIALRLDLHPAWLARAYRHFSGEGLAETARRHRVEAATALLRRTDLPLAEIAHSAGFCDQSHMNRCFAAVLGRTPTRVRAERLQAAG
jgi:AraC family transcriptional regulator